MANRNKRSLGIDYSILASESSKVVPSPCSLAASSSILHLALDNANLKFKQLSASPDFIPILHYAAISVRRFCFDVDFDIDQLLKIANKSEIGTLAEELFILEIFIINGMEFSAEKYPKIQETFPIFQKDLEVTMKKTKDLGYLADAPQKPHGDVNPEEVLTDEMLIETYKQSEIEFWTLMLEYNRYNAITALIQELRTNKMTDFPSEFLQAQIRGSPEALKVMEEYIKNSFDPFFSDDRWIDFIKRTPELIDYMIKEVIPLLKPAQLNPCLGLYDSFLKQYMYQVYCGGINIEMFINFVYMGGEDNLLIVIGDKEGVENTYAIEFREIFLSHFDELFAKKRWCKFTEKNPGVLKYIALNIYPHVPIEKKKLIPGLNERLLNRLLAEENIDDIVDFLYGLPVEFLLYQFEENEDTAVAFRNAFTINFDSYIVDKRIRDLILSSSTLLDIIITNIIPKSETKQKNICQDLYGQYLYRKITADERNAQPTADFVKDIMNSATSDFFKFENLIPSIQYMLYEAVSKKLTLADLNQHKKLYSEFFIPFMKEPSLCLLIPDEIRQSFYRIIAVPFYTENKLELSVKHIYRLVNEITKEPFKDQERPEFFTFIVEHQEELYPLVTIDDSLIDKIWTYITTNEKECRAANTKQFIFRICMFLLRKTIPDTPKLFQLTVQTFSNEVFQNKITTDEKIDIILQMSKCFQRPLDVLFPETDNLRTYCEAAQNLMDLFSSDPSFLVGVQLTLNEENINFLPILIGVFKHERAFKALIEKSELFIRFLSRAIEYFPSNVTNDLLTQVRFEDIFTFFNKYSYQISLDDLVRNQLLYFFLDNRSQLERFLPCVTSPLHRACIYTEFTDPAKNAVLHILFNTYVEKSKRDTPIANIMNVYVTAMNMPFVKVKCHTTLFNRMAEAFNNPDQAQFDACFPPMRQIEIENALYGFGKATSLTMLIQFVEMFKGMEPGEQNCYKAATENVLLRFTNQMVEEEEKDEKANGEENADVKNLIDKDTFVNYQKEHPRFRRFSQDPDRFPEFVQGIIAFALIFYCSILSYSDNKAATVTCALLASVIVAISAFAPQYFPALQAPGFTPWFFVQISLLVCVFGLGFAVYGLSENYDINIPLIVIIVSYVALTLFRLIYNIQGIPQDEYDATTDLLIIN